MCDSMKYRQWTLGTEHFLQKIKKTANNFKLCQYVWLWCQFSHLFPTFSFIYIDNVWTLFSYWKLKPEWWVCFYVVNLPQSTLGLQTAGYHPWKHHTFCSSGSSWTNHNKRTRVPVEIKQNPQYTAMGKGQESASLKHTVHEDVFVQSFNVTLNSVGTEKSRVHTQFLTSGSEHLKHGEFDSNPVYSNCGGKTKKGYYQLLMATTPIAIEWHHTSLKIKSTIYIITTPTIDYFNFGFRFIHFYPVNALSTVSVPLFLTFHPLCVHWSQSYLQHLDAPWRHKEGNANTNEDQANDDKAWYDNASREYGLPCRKSLLSEGSVVRPVG